MGCDTNIARIVLAMVLVQVLAAYLLQNETWTTVVIVAYCFGGVVNHCMTLAIHEIGHNLAFGHTRLMWNRWIGFIGNMCVGVPMSISFKRYHQDHHRFQVSQFHDNGINKTDILIVKDKGLLPRQLIC